MHESSLARRILDAVLARTDGSRVTLVRGWIADTETLSRASLAFHFAAHAHGTRAEGARLELRLEQVAARCRGCGTQFAPDHHVALCPACGGTDAVLLGPTGIGIDAVDVTEP